MVNYRLRELNQIIDDLIFEIDRNAAYRLDLEKCKRMAERLVEFSEKCPECELHLITLEKRMRGLSKQHLPLEGPELRDHNKFIREISSHLQKKHGLVPKGAYISIFMSIGIGVGLILGQIFFENIAIGMPIGLGVGIAIGAALDMDAEKKGKSF